MPTFPAYHIKPSEKAHKLTKLTEKRAHIEMKNRMFRSDETSLVLAVVIKFPIPKEEDKIKLR
ncbi:CLUMA_CG002765, isoform A [Clunio marinus]|uniref:CLUMA_CG002765, isoform A n=1 Tax=Clunio marinus TaxID=568069 RepID=A0A1J1HLC6_9DIPT|nr:CLUMA_CG002765, isoform A [Clunio marinus]